MGHGAPAEFRMPDFEQASKWGKTQYSDVLKPTAGALGALHVEFQVHREYDGAASEEIGEEVYKPVEICLIQTDKFSRVPLRVGKKGEKIQDKTVIEKTIERVMAFEGVPDEAKEKAAQAIRRSGVVVGKVTSELSRQQEIELAPLFQRFKEQKDSTDTDIFKWQALNDSERGLLASQGIYTAEQLYHTPAEQRYRLGPGGEELWERASRFMRAKQKEADRNSHAEELRLLREEREKQSAKMNEMQDQYFKLQEQLAELTTQAKGKPGRPKKTETETE